MKKSFQLTYGIFYIFVDFFRDIVIQLKQAIGDFCLMWLLLFFTSFCLTWFWFLQESRKKLKMQVEH